MSRTSCCALPLLSEYNITPPKTQRAIGRWSGNFRYLCSHKRLKWLKYYDATLGLPVLKIQPEGETAIYVILFAAPRPFRVPWQSFVFPAPIAAFFALGGGTLSFPLPRD